MVPSTIEIKHQLLTLWLKDEVAKEAAAAAANDIESVVNPGIEHAAGEERVPGDLL